MMMKCILAAAVGAALAGSASAATVVNGGFEEPGTFSGGWATYGVGSTAITGWEIEAGDVDLINTYWQHAEGSYSLDLGGNVGARISQTVTGLVTGADYILNFALAGNPDGPPTIKMVEAAVGATAQTFSFDITGRTLTDMGWIYQALPFVAEAESMLLRFTSIDPPLGEAGGFYGPALDDVSIRLAPIPLPAAGWLMLAGLGGLAALRRRRTAA